MIIGIDVGGTNARALLIDPDSGQIKGRCQTPSIGNGSELVTALTDLINQLPTDSATSVGLAIAGLVNRTGTVHYSPHLPGLLDYPIGPELQQRCGLPVTVSNDATAGTWAEARLGAGQRCDNFAFVALGTGIGAGLVLNGQLVLGAHGFAGEAGHMTINAQGPTHLTGQPGPWEYFASGNALGRLGQEAAANGAFAQGLAAAGSPQAITGQHVSTAVATGDPQALEIFDHYCQEIARGAASLATLLDLERIVLGGGLAAIGEPLRSGVAAWLPTMLFGASHRPEVEICLAQQGTDAGALGAALIAQNQNGSEKDPQ